jgi:hypothetical protein
MSALERLNDYLRRLERRLRIRELSRGAAALGAAALGMTVLLVMIVNSRAFSAPSVTGARIALFLALAFVLAFGLILPFVRLNRNRAARRAEEAFPEFEERLLTYAERSGDAEKDPFLELLADDALRVAQAAEPRRIVTPHRITGFLSAAAGAIAVLIWLGVAGPGYLGYGTSLLWAGAGRGAGKPFYDVRVVPGDHKVRRGSDQLVSAYLSGFATHDVRLMARYEGASKWEEVRMRSEVGGSGFEFLFAGLPESVDYYVIAGAVRTKRFRLDVVDLPRVKRIRVTYRYPDWARLQDTVEENGGDLRAVEGTEADLAIETDKPLDSGVAMISDGPEVTLNAGEGNWASGRVRIDKDGLYHIAALHEGEKVRITEDYFIEALKEMAPIVRIHRPGRDYRANPVEEVTIAAEAEDDFGLHELSLLYSVNGGPEQKIDLLGRAGAKQAGKSAVIALEDHNLVPGDVISFYAVARDARTSSRTDMFFIEAQPFEREYSQSQQSGGMGGGGDQDQNRISERQKEIIAATWNIIRDQNLSRAKAAEDGKFLSDVQAALKDQALSLARRMQARELAGTNEEFKSFSRDMEAAAAAMGEAADKLKALGWREALPPEQKALQHLLRAESMFRKIQVARGSRGGGGGGGGNMGRDLENLFDLELDTEKNQYETGQRGASGGQQAREIDEALQKLKELARRQQELAQQQQRQQQSFQQRWQQEMLRREAEQLQRRIEELSRGQSSQQGSSQSSQQAMSRGGAQGRSQGDARIQQTLERLKQATEEMRRANSAAGQGSAEGNAESRRAAERLQEASELLSGLRRQEAGQQLGDISERAQKLAGQQREFADRLKNLYAQHQALTGQTPQGRQPAADPREVARLAEEKKAMADELQSLERQMQQAVRDLAGSQQASSSKLREALGEMQQRELTLRMKYLAEWIRRGLGAYAWLREAPVTEGLDRLSRQLGEAQRALGESPRSGENLDSALARVEQLRNQLQRLTEEMQRGEQGRQGAQRGGQRGEQGGAQRGEQGGQQGAQSGGNQPGGQQGGAAPGEGDRRGEGRQYGGAGGPLRSFSAMNTGERLPPDTGIEPPATDYRGIEQAYREGLRDLSELRRSMRENPDLAGDLQELIRQMQRLDPKRFPGNPALVEQLRTQLLPTLEHVELLLRRQLEDSGEGQVRSGLARPVPPGYADAVAEYYRKLSRSQ